MMENRYAKVEGHPNIVRDLQTNAIINTDTLGMQNYISSKKKRDSEKQTMKNLVNDIEELKSSIEEIKLLMRRISNEA